MEQMVYRRGRTVVRISVYQTSCEKRFLQEVATVNCSLWTASLTLLLTLLLALLPSKLICMHCIPGALYTSVSRQVDIICSKCNRTILHLAVRRTLWKNILIGWSTCVKLCLHSYSTMTRYSSNKYTTAFYA